MDANGDFVITWQRYGSDGGSGLFGASYGGENGVYAKRYTKGGVAASNVFQVNQTTTGTEQNASVAMDAAGDFVITWESNQNGNYDVYARWYANTRSADFNTFDSATGLPITAPDPPYYGTLWPGLVEATNPIYGPNGEMTGEIMVNSTTAGDQRYPSVSMDDPGDAVVVWSGNGTGDSQGVFFQRYAQPTDDAPPTVAKVQSVDSSGNVGIAVDNDVIKAQSLLPCRYLQRSRLSSPGAECQELDVDAERQPNPRRHRQRAIRLK